MSEEEYADYYSDNEQPEKPARRDLADEQQTQKMNGKIEDLESRIRELERELRSEKEAHDDTKFCLKAAKEESMTASIDSLSVRTANTGATTELKSEFFKFCTKHAVPVSVSDADSLTDAACISILKGASKALASKKDGSGGGGNAAESVDARVRALENELRLALGAAEDIRALKSKVIQMIERIRLEKENKLKVETDLASTRKKMEILGDHMEKLMVNLRHEATAKIRSAEALRLSEKNVLKWKERCDIQSRKNNAKERLIIELREGCKILEDQLRLMDEKYLELRVKLDWTREHGMKKLNKAENSAKELRMKFFMATNSQLDNVQLPEISTASSINSSDVYSVNDFSQHSGFTAGNSSLKSASSRKHLKTSRSFDSAGSNSFRDEEPTLDKVNEKLRRRQGKAQEWTEDKIRDLISTR